MFYIGLLISLFFSSLLYSHGHELVHMEGLQGQNIFFFGDQHKSTLPYNQKNTQQRKDFIELAQRLEAVAIMEDSHPYNSQELRTNFPTYNNNQFSSSLLLFFYLNKSDFFLQGLSSLCTHAKIENYNVEFRFCTHVQSFEDIVRLYKNTINEIVSYQDGDALTTIYQKCIDVWIAEITLDLINGPEIYNSLFDTWYKKILAKIVLNDEQRNFLHGYNIAFAGLLDAKILHHLFTTYRDEKNVFIAVGAWHVSNLVTYLTELGYTIKHEYAFVRDFYGYEFYEFDAISFKDVFAEWGIPLKEEFSPTIAHKILSMKLYLESKGIDNFPFGELIIGVPIACISTGLQMYLNSISFPFEGKVQNVFTFCTAIAASLASIYAINWYINRPLKRPI